MYRDPIWPTVVLILDLLGILAVILMSLGVVI